MRLRFLLFLLASYILLSQRIFVRVDTGGSGILPILSVLLPIAIACLLVAHRSGRTVVLLLRSRGAWLWWGFAVLAAALPVLGVAIGGYGAPTLLGVLEGVIPVSALILGAHCATQDVAFRRYFPRYLVGLCVVEAALAVGQFLFTAGFVQAAMLARLREWDLVVQQQYSEAYVVMGRSIGTFINPNVLGIWSTMAILLSVYALRGRARVIAVAAATISLLLCQSRGALAAALGTFGVIALLNAGRLLLGGRSTRTSIVATLVGAAGLAMVPMALVIMSGAAEGVPIIGGMLTRFQQGYLVLSQGAGADQNLLERVVVWKLALDFAVGYPLGTFGPPQLKFIYAIDSDYFRLLLQGGLLYVGWFVILMVRGARMVGRRDGAAAALGAMSIAVLINAVTAHPLASPPMVLYWLFAGYVLAGARLRARRAGISPPSLAPETGSRRSREVAALRPL